MLGDCLAYMKTMPAGCIDLTITSPPYDNLRTYDGTFEAGMLDWRAVICELYRITDNGGVVVWVVADATIDGSETGTSFRQALWALECGFHLHDTMIYEVAGTGAKGSNYAYWQSFEYMFVWSKGAPRTVNRIADRKNARAGVLVTRGEKTKDVGTRLGDYTVPDLGIRSNVWRYHAGNNGGEITGHPAPFPLKLASDHVRSWSVPGDLVFDPFLGSGTTGIAAVVEGRRFLGVEINPAYHAIAARRIAAAQMQLALPLGDA